MARSPSLSNFFSFSRDHRLNMALRHFTIWDQFVWLTFFLSVLFKVIPTDEWRKLFVISPRLACEYLAKTS